MTDNYVDESGLHTQSLVDIVTELETGFKAIYGADINVAANSPDGQMINLFAQAKIDMLDLITDIYGSFSPTNARGAVLDQRCAINGVTRQGATYTVVNISIVVDRDVYLTGVNDGSPFTISDGAGNKFVLIDSVLVSIYDTPGTVHAFRAYDKGAVSVTIATLTTIDTITLGVLSVNNATSPTTQGVDEELDAALRLRRAVSVSLPSSGFLEGLQGALAAIDGVTQAKVYENNTGTTDGDGIPGHTIWCIVEGGDDDEIANVIYVKRNAGCGMKGSEVVAIPQVNGFSLPVMFDRPSLEDLYIELTIVSLDPSVHTIDEDFIKKAIYDGVTYGINQTADFTAISAVVKAADPYAVITAGGVGDDGMTYASLLVAPTIDARWVISTTRISIT
jgi:uncharacterized phage protein gp47/JayE